MSKEKRTIPVTIDVGVELEYINKSVHINIPKINAHSHCRKAIEDNSLDKIREMKEIEKLVKLSIESHLRYYHDFILNQNKDEQEDTHSK
jgi:hypothetical protein